MTQAPRRARPWPKAQIERVYERCQALVVKALGRRLDGTERDDVVQRAMLTLMGRDPYEPNNAELRILLVSRWKDHLRAEGGQSPGKKRGARNVPIHAEGDDDKPAEELVRDDGGDVDPEAVVAHIDATYGEVRQAALDAVRGSARETLVRRLELLEALHGGATTVDALLEGLAGAEFRKRRNVMYQDKRRALEALLLQADLLPDDEPFPSAPGLSTRQLLKKHVEAMGSSDPAAGGVRTS